MFGLRINFKFILFLSIWFVLIQVSGFCGLFAAGSTESQIPIRIMLKETSDVKQSRIFLKDIADISANGFLGQEFEKIEIGPSPKPGEIKSFDKNKIITLIKGQRYLPKNIIVISPGQIYVKRLGQTIPKQEIRQFVETKLSSLFKHKEYQLKTFDVRGLELYPQGSVNLVFDSDKFINKNGKIVSHINVIIDGDKQDRLGISGMVAVYENVLCAVRSVKKGQPVTMDDLVLKKKNIFDLSHDYIKNFDEVDGKILKSGLKKGSYLKASLLAEPFMVQKGDVVTLVAKNKNLLIVTSAISMENGFENETIKVENFNSGRIVRAIVKDKSRVEVIY